MGTFQSKQPRPSSAELDEFVMLRRQIHAAPELGSDTPNTAALVADRLQAWGYEVHRNVGGHGVVGVLKAGDSPRSIGLRADMDALPMSEKNRFEHASKIPGRMHACGHDGHTAILLAAAAQLAETRDFDGTVNVIFQPDEEGLGGAKAMIDDGLFERFPCDSVYALHNMPGLPVGTCVVQAGPTMASSERVSIRITGKGGHGAMPELSVDPVMALNSLISGIQTIKSRNLSVDEYAVISIGMIQAGTVYNIIPDEACMLLSVRTDTAQTQHKINRRIDALVKGHAESFGVAIDVQFTQLAPALCNSDHESTLLRESLRPLFADGSVLDKMPSKVMGTEDFAYMLEARPGCYFMLGNGTGEFHGCSVHNPHYDFNDALVKIGADCWVKWVQDYLR
ncbi:M20 aminoacylase family protein [Pseudomonas sp. KCJK8670]|uniref:M20 aminoacylase family protein n=1 Tax=Pseudomonas sp. KCJK8670 TaxID=3344558 RepID=UPI003906AAAA